MDMPAGKLAYGGTIDLGGAIIDSNGLARGPNAILG